MRPKKAKLLFIHACVHAKLLQLCLTSSDSMDCSLPGPSVHGLLLAITLEWVTRPCFGGSSWLRNWTRISYSSCIAGGFFTFELLGKPFFIHKPSHVKQTHVKNLLRYLEHSRLSRWSIHDNVDYVNCLVCFLLLHWQRTSYKITSKEILLTLNIQQFSIWLGLDN